MHLLRRGPFALCVSAALILSLCLVQTASAVAGRNVSGDDAAGWIRTQLHAEHGEVVDRAVELALEHAPNDRSTLLLAFASALLELDSGVAEAIAGVSDPSAAQIVRAIEQEAGGSLNATLPVSQRQSFRQYEANTSVARHVLLAPAAHSQEAPPEAVEASSPVGSADLPPIFTVLNAAQPLGP